MNHNCPRCGEKTTGAYSEGGLRWAICEDCYCQLNATVLAPVEAMKGVEKKS